MQETNHGLIASVCRMEIRFAVGDCDIKGMEWEGSKRSGLSNRRFS